MVIRDILAMVLFAGTLIPVVLAGVFVFASCGESPHIYEDFPTPERTIPTPDLRTWDEKMTAYHWSVIEDAYDVCEEFALRRWNAETEKVFHIGEELMLAIERDFEQAAPSERVKTLALWAEIMEWQCDRSATSQ